ncbi:MAG: cytidylyltransferase domain-containing protein [Candidatus Woesearchaeota archaeon]
MKIVTLIPARGGSKGIPKKNIKLLAGQPLISYTIKASLNSKANDTYVSTDCHEIHKISKIYGAKVIKRPKEFATDSASTESVLLHFAKKINFDILILLQCTSPFTTSEDISNAINIFKKNKYDSMLSVCDDHGGFLCGGFNWDENGNPINYNINKRPRRQDMKKVYRENGAIYIMTKKGLLKHKNRLFGNIGIYHMPIYRSFEIDEPGDFEIAEQIMINKKKLLIDTNKIKAIFFDVDGVFTDGSVYLDKNNNEQLKFSRIDGKGIELIRDKYITGVISAENSEIVRNRMNKLKINEIHLGIKKKIEIYNRLKKKYHLKDDEICYCGDDIQDMDILKIVGLPCSPINAQNEVKNISRYISNKKGGEGFVRDICNIIMHNSNIK